MTANSFAHLLQESQVARHRDLLAKMMADLPGISEAEQPDISTHVLGCENAPAIAASLMAQGIPANGTGGTLTVFDERHPLYAQNRMGINKIGMAIVRAVTGR